MTSLCELQWPTLRFSDPAKETAFLLWLVPQPRWSNTILMFLATVFMTIYLQTIDVFGSDTGHGTTLVVTFTVFFVLTVVDFICVATSRWLGPDSDKTAVLIRITDAIFCAYIVNMIVTEITLISYFITLDCSSEFVFFADQQKVYRSANCFRRFTTGSAPLLIFLPLKRIRFVNSLVTSIMAAVAMAVTLSIWPHKTLTLTIGHVVVVTALLAFISYVHFLMERDARKYFATRELLREYTDKAKARADALEDYVQTLVPPELLSRSSRHIAVDQHDVSETAVVLVVGVPDFTAQSTKWVPVTLAMKIESAHNLLFTELEQCPVERVSVVLDEVVAVGNLLRPDNVPRSVVHTCSAVDRTLRTITKGGGLPQHASIDVGLAMGGFLGSTHIRYDVWGEAVRTARVALNYGDSGQLVLTDSARHVAHTALDVREGPTMTAVEESSSVVGDDPQTLWIFCSCDENAFDEELVGLSCTSPSETEVELQPKTPLASSVNLFSSRSSSVSEPLKLTALSRAVRLTGELKDLAGENKLAMQTRWLAYKVFTDVDTEAAFVKQRQRTMLQRAGHMWLGYAVVVLVLLVILVADLDEHRGAIAVIMLIIAALLSVVVSVTSGLIGEDDTIAHTVWSVLSLLVPLLTTMACAVGRPSSVGNDMRHLMIISTIVRGPSFRHARHQLIVVPLLAIVFHAHMILPGAIMQLPSLYYLTLVIFVMVTDQENDMSQRHNFIAEHEISTKLRQLELEETIRLGLVLTALPPALLPKFTDLEPCRVLTTIQPDSVVVLVTARPPITPGQNTILSPKHQQHLTAGVEAAAQECRSLTIVKVFGDNVLIVNPLGSEQVSPQAELARCCDILRLFALLQRHSETGYQIIVEADTTTQLLEKVSGLPSFKVMGTAVSRVLAIGSSGAAMLPGLLVTERAQTMMNVSGALEHSDLGPWTQRTLPPWRVRGLGVLRLVQFEASP